MAGNEAPATMSQAEFARHRSVSKKTATVWKQQGFLVIAADGRIDVAGSAKLLDARGESYRGGVTRSAPRGNAQGNSVKAKAEPEDEKPDPDGLMTLPQAQRAKETYLALQRKSEFEEGQGRLVSVETVGKYVEAQYGLVRDRLVVIPGKVADKCAGKAREEIEVIIMAEINEALNELHAPSVENRG